MVDETIETGPKNDFMLKFADEAEMLTAMAAFTRTEETPVLDEEGNQVIDENGDPSTETNTKLVKATPEYAIDVIGVIQKATGNTLTDDEGNEYPEIAPIDGWHVNFRLMSEGKREAIEAVAETYEVTPTPATPHRVWA